MGINPMFPVLPSAYSSVVLVHHKRKKSEIISCRKFVPLNTLFYGTGVLKSYDSDSRPRFPSTFRTNVDDPQWAPSSVVICSTLSVGLKCTVNGLL